MVAEKWCPFLLVYRHHQRPLQQLLQLPAFRQHQLQRRHPYAAFQQLVRFIMLEMQHLAWYIIRRQDVMVLKFNIQDIIIFLHI